MPELLPVVEVDFRPLLGSLSWQRHIGRGNYVLRYLNRDWYDAKENGSVRPELLRARPSVVPAEAAQSRVLGQYSDTKTNQISSLMKWLGLLIVSCREIAWLD